MNTLLSIACRRLRLTLLLGLMSLLALLAPQAASAHPLDVYLQATYITVAPTQIVVELDLSPGVLVAPQVLPQLDPDGDQRIADGEGRAYVETILRSVALQVDGQARALVVTKIDMPPYLTIQAGYGTIRVFTAATLAGGMAGTHTIAYTNDYAPTGAAYQVNAFVDKGAPITLGKQNRDGIQQSMAMDYAIGGVAPGAAVPAATVTTGTPAATTGIPAGAPGQARRLLASLYAPALSPWALLLALALAGVVGGLHALTPDHGKTLVAAYLVGSRGTVRHAVALGAIVTFTHTASVIVIGALALFASRFIVPGVLVPILETLSGVLVVSMGTRLVRQRWATFRRRQRRPQDNTLDHGHIHAYTHDHGDGHSHAHLPPAAAFTMGGLVAMGVSGGMVPCPEALGIMIVAIGLNRVALGLGLIVSFSFGLAAALIAIGILLVRSRALVERFGGLGSRWSSGLPLASAAIVTALGVGITLRGLASYRGLPGFGHDLTLSAGIVIAVALLGIGLAMLIERLRTRTMAVPAQRASAATVATPPVPKELLPPRYRDGRAVSDAPMGAAPLVYDAAGRVAWDRIWGGDDPDNPFCDLALAGGPPHRGTLLEPVDPADVRADPEGHARAVGELARGLRIVTGLNVTTDATPGWVGLVCDDEEMARWLLRAIVAENVAVRREGRALYLPVGPSFRVDGEIKNVVTAVAKTHHYWTEHALADGAILAV